MSSSADDVQAKIQEDAALAKHVARFSVNGFFSPSTVTEGLQKIHGTQAHIKGPIIAMFNAAHSGRVCPFLSTEFKADPITGYAKYLHLGTTRIWNPDGTVNEESWRRFVALVIKNQEEQVEKVVTKSALKSYLKFCYENDPQEAHTGRNTSSWFSSGSIQATAATAAWDEVFERLTCGWSQVQASTELEPYITLDLVRLFFDDSAAAFQKAETQQLPVAKPSTVNIEAMPEQACGLSIV